MQHVLAWGMRGRDFLFTQGIQRRSGFAGEYDLARGCPL
jgi:hypothetical protein